MTDALETCRQIIEKHIPNLFRLYLNPFVAQSCYCLAKYANDLWPIKKQRGSSPGHYQVFLGNGADEGLSGALKLLRSANHVAGAKSSQTLLLDGKGTWLEHFASTTTSNQEISFLPEIDWQQGQDLEAQRDECPSTYGIIALPLNFQGDWGTVHRLIEHHQPAIILIADQASIKHCRENNVHPARSVEPDIVLFDESFTNHEVPFSAIVGKSEHFAHWTRKGMKSFHSTTFQPNTIASLHFLECLKECDPQYYSLLKPSLVDIETNLHSRKHSFSNHFFSPLPGLISVTGFDKSEPTTKGHYLVKNRERIFDGVGGVACSLRGHNPPAYVKDITTIRAEHLDPKQEVTNRLAELTGLPHALPGVSGANAVEQALKLALVTAFPRTNVIALTGGFGGKTLLSLTGTSKEKYKSGLKPLYPDVTYINPFGFDAIVQLEKALGSQPTAVVQIECIQGVGGVRPIPQNLLEALGRLRRQYGFLLFVDEIQTGFYRTGPFCCSKLLGLQADLLTLGKGASDMMFPFSLTLYSHQVADQLKMQNCLLANIIRQQYGYALGYQTVLNTLIHAKAEGWENRITQRGERLASQLKSTLEHCPAVRDIRCYGMLIGIELETGNPLGKYLPSLYLLDMLRDKHFPVLMGFCQYEPHVLKLTPPLTITEDEIDHLCSTLQRTLTKPKFLLATRALFSTIQGKIPHLRRRIAPSSLGQA